MIKLGPRLRRLLSHFLIALTLCAPVLMHGGSWLLSLPANAAHQGASPAQDQTSHCPQHQSKDSNCCPQCVTWLAVTPVDSKKAFAFKTVSWPELEPLAPAPLLVGNEKRDDGGGCASARPAFEALFARTSRLII